MNRRFALPLLLLLILLPAAVFSMSGRKQQRDAPDGCPADGCLPTVENRSSPAAASRPADVQTNGNLGLINAIDSGWYTNDGFHFANNTNYIVGFSGLDSNIWYNNFFVFDLTSVQSQVVTATLLLENPLGSYLTGDQMVPEVDTEATGQARFLRNEDDSEIFYELTLYGINDATAAHIHCAPSNQNGPIGVTLPIGSSSGSGVVSTPNAGNGCGWSTLTQVVAALEASNAYVLVHTAAYPGGEIRGGGALGTISEDASEQWVAYEVRTPINQLVAENVGRTDIYSDLGNGPEYGSGLVSDNGVLVDIPLNSLAVKTINAARGGQLAIGGALNSVTQRISPELVFGFSHLGNHIRQLALVTSIDCNDVSEIPQVECATLIALFNSAGGLDWLNRSGWLATETPCTWHGVQCNGGHVDSLDLSGNSLAGTLPKEFGDLTGLSSVKVYDNARLAGPLPLSMADLSPSLFWFQNTTLCVPPALDSWLAGIADSNGTGATCQYANLPVVTKK